MTAFREAFPILYVDDVERAAELYRTVFGFEETFRLVRDQIGQVHMRDLFLEEYPWRQLLTTLSNIQFGGYCFAEIPESADPVRVLEYFRGLFRAYQNL